MYQPAVDKAEQTLFAILFGNLTQKRHIKFFPEVVNSFQFSAHQIQNHQDKGCQERSQYQTHNSVLDCSADRIVIDYFFAYHNGFALVIFHIFQIGLHRLKLRIQRAVCIQNTGLIILYTLIYTFRPGRRKQLQRMGSHLSLHLPGICAKRRFRSFCIGLTSFRCVCPNLNPENCRLILRVACHIYYRRLIGSSLHRIGRLHVKADQILQL